MKVMDEQRGDRSRSFEPFWSSIPRKNDAPVSATELIMSQSIFSPKSFQTFRLFNQNLGRLYTFIIFFTYSVTFWLLF